MILDRIFRRQKISPSTDVMIQHYIQHIYQQSHHSVSRRAAIAETSGEIQLSGINKILGLISIKADDHFMDLGSGTGKVVLHFFLRTCVKQSSGIEIVDNQYACSNQIAARVKADVPSLFQLDKKLNYIHGDFLIESFHDATILLIASPCFTPTMLDKIAGMIDLNIKIHTVISLRPLINLKRLVCRKVFSVDCSWDTSLCYLYEASRITS